ncbi:hypothetical protein IPG41_06340 [Candidatus Peregrinibacteria bacterium]|nr:MAG: hypothetical protein IPG41_06340 [Candidatus Peregrinibacteria bacterium]
MARVQPQLPDWEQVKKDFDGMMRTAVEILPTNFSEEDFKKLLLYVGYDKRLEISLFIAGIWSRITEVKSVGLEPEQVKDALESLAYLGNGWSLPQEQTAAALNLQSPFFPGGLNLNNCNFNNVVLKGTVAGRINLDGANIGNVRLWGTKTTGISIRGFNGTLDIEDSHVGFMDMQNSSANVSLKGSSVGTLNRRGYKGVLTSEGSDVQKVINEEYPGFWAQVKKRWT